MRGDFSTSSDDRKYLVRAHNAEGSENSMFFSCSTVRTVMQKVELSVCFCVSACVLMCVSGGRGATSSAVHGGNRFSVA